MNRILIVEDEAIVSLDIQNRLQRLGYEVVGIADTGLEALELARDEQPDIVLMDIHIYGDIDGIETSRLIRKEIDVPVVFLTANSDKNTIQRAQETEPFAYIIKPFKDTELNSTIEIALHRHKLEKELETRVQERTAELARVNDQLRREVAESQRISKVNAELEQQLRQSQRMESLGQLAGGIAHDFNNMLTIIKGYSELVLGSIDQSGPLYDDVNMVREAAERATALTSKLLTFGRRQPLDITTFEINTTIRSALDMLRPLLGETVRVETELHPDPLFIHTDASLFDQVIINLSVNARDAMPAGGQINISTAICSVQTEQINRFINLSPGAYALISIRDTGIGMSEEILNRIFEPFYTTKNTGKGTGLGLAMVYSIIQQSGGQIDVHSAPDKGTNFEVYLPLADDQEATIAQKEPILSTAQAVSHGTVLLAEDEQVVRDLTARILTEVGFEVLSADGGHQAVALAQQHDGPIDLLLTDVVMADINGCELARQISQRIPSIPVVFMSGHSRASLAQYGVQQEEFAFLQKPFSPQTLIDAVNEALSKRL
jgi:two-component system cell cycle sensor histidine kinase/response regulator CckA